MGFFDRIFGARASANAHDPTVAWAPAQGPSPQISLEGQSVGTPFARLLFGSDVSAAQCFGRADDFRGNEHHFTLTYDKWGLELSFEARQLAEVAFRIH